MVRFHFKNNLYLLKYYVIWFITINENNRYIILYVHTYISTTSLGGPWHHLWLSSMGFYPLQLLSILISLVCLYSFLPPPSTFLIIIIFGILEPAVLFTCRGHHCHYICFSTKHPQFLIPSSYPYFSLSSFSKNFQNFSHLHRHPCLFHFV